MSFSMIRVSQVVLLTVSSAGLAVSSLANACQPTTIGFGGASCPPNGYGNPQPPYDCDYDGDGTNDSWCKPITIPNPAGPGNLPATDSCGNTLSLPCVGDPMTPGGGQDYFRPTWKKPGEMGPGTELGRCLYECGRNTWKVWVCDTDGDGTPDKFTKSEWTTKNGGSNWPYTGESKTFCVPMNVASVRGESMSPLVIVSSTYTNLVDFSDGYTIDDVVVLRSFPTSLANVVVDNQPLGEYLQPIDIGPIEKGVGQDLVMVVGPVFTRVALGEAQSLARTSSGARVLMFENTIENTDTKDHAYEISLFGRNLSLASDRVSIEIPAGESRTFVVEAVETGPGVAALAALAYSDTFDIDDAYTSVSVVAPATSWSDIDLNGRVGTSDLAILINRWGVPDQQDAADLNDDGVINGHDLAILLSDWDLNP